MLLTVALGFIGNSLISFGQVIQKSQVQSFELKEKAVQKARHAGKWILGIVGSNAGLAILYWAVSIGSASVVGAMNGSGLVALIVFSRLILGERIDRWEISGIALIILGVVLFPLSPMPIETNVIPDIDGLWIGVGVVVCVLAGLLAVMTRKGKPSGAALGLLAGAFTGFSTLFQKVASIEIAANGAGSFVFTAVWLGFFLLSFLSLQFAYRKNRILKIIPYFTAVKALVPLVGGLLFFSERLSALQWIGVGSIFTGILVIFLRFSLGRRAGENNV